jgi:hypothetical protein
MARSGPETEENNKKFYEKPRLTKIKLDPQCAVLGFCKNSAASGNAGPRGVACGVPFICRAAGS